MKLISLLENSTTREDCGCAHGLSLYIETPQHCILFDMGPNNMFWENAETLGVDLKRVDMAFLSHGHYDHSGGLELFCKQNLAATIFRHPLAFGPYYAQEGDQYRYIGVNVPPLEKYEVRFRTATGQIDSELAVFDGVDTHDFLSGSAGSLLEQTADGYQPDAFLHEQHLILTCEGKKVLIAGCAHSGIVNILRRAESLVGELDYVFGGFHLTNPGLGEDEPRELVESIGKELMKRRTKFITGHCTGRGPYQILKDQMGDQIDEMPVGRVFEF